MRGRIRPSRLALWCGLAGVLGRGRYARATDGAPSRGLPPIAPVLSSRMVYQRRCQMGRRSRWWLLSGVTLACRGRGALWRVWRHGRFALPPLGALPAYGDSLEAWCVFASPPLGSARGPCGSIRQPGHGAAFGSPREKGMGGPRSSRAAPGHLPPQSGAGGWTARVATSRRGDGAPGADEAAGRHGVTQRNPRGPVCAVPCRCAVLPCARRASTARLAIWDGRGPVASSLSRPTPGGASRCPSQ